MAQKKRKKKSKKFPKRPSKHKLSEKQRDLNKVLINKCSFSIHFQFVSAHCVNQLFFSYALL